GLSSACRGRCARGLAAAGSTEEPVFSDQGLSPLELLGKSLAEALGEGVAAARRLSRQSLHVTIAEVGQVRVEIGDRRWRRARQFPELLFLVPQHRDGEEEWISPCREKLVPTTIV